MSKAVWKPGTFINPVPAVMVTCGTMEKSNFLKNDEGNPELELLIGIVLLAAGLFMLSKRVIVHTGRC